MLPFEGKYVFTGSGPEECVRKGHVMPKGPRGERRPADVVSAAVMVAKIATGEIEDSQKSGRVKSGHAGAKARAKNLTPKQRSEIAQKAAAARWR